MHIILSLPELAEQGLCADQMALDTEDDFIIGCSRCVGETPQGFHFRPTFSCFALSGKQEECGEIFCMNPACTARLKYILRKG
ncbi:MAG: hypothetical protein ACQGQP_01730 [Desulfovibrio sp.]|jgi:hypothetical protein|nr:hypothetical protein [Mailhella sp.]